MRYRYKELNTFTHRSLYDGKMNACGHDGHIAMLLGVIGRTIHLNPTFYFTHLVPDLLKRVD